MPQCARAGGGEQLQQHLASLGGVWEAIGGLGVTSYSVGIGTWGKSGRRQWAVVLLSGMWNSHVEPNVTGYSVRIGACENSGQRRWASPQRDVEFECGARRHLLQCWDQRL